ncbi:protein-tyrosine kinase 6b [Melanotaenia boesemani]|uniref:protein-tyrosine kinase 6b n=1 Tax=Melanotaenia boesemani TaxID=1250792 RepID=UPI001C0436B1|nr:protein-tyrosine kinase 6b [Melanotaenia boesemani]
MGECLRKVCPCLESLWQRIFQEKKTAPRDDGDSGGVREERPPRSSPPPPSQQSPTETAVYTALWPFESRHPDELSFQEGDLFSVVSSNGDWWTARKIDRNGCVLDTGIVPHNYLLRTERLQTQPWFYGKMSRSEAQSHMIGPQNEVGAFLIRNSEKDRVGYVLSVKSSDRVKHFKIHQKAEKTFYVEHDQLFSSLVELVEYYRINSLSTTGPLRNPCKRKKPNIQDLSHFTVGEFELPKAEFTLGDELGSGQFANVYRGCWRNQINVAIKILKSDSEMNQREFYREVQILKGLRHRHLITLFAVCTASNPYYIITELMAKGSLLQFLRGPEGKHQDLASLIDMSAQVADGMSYLEERNSIHRDLAARNVLVGEDYICKVADFGLARIIKEPFYITENKMIPFKWCSPEAISHGKFSIKSDVWSFGVLLYEIMSYGGIPYPAYSNQDVYEQVLNGYRMPAPFKCPRFIHQIMLNCWSIEPDNRPDFRSLRAQLENSPYELE